jgi:hypothetical protein
MELVETLERFDLIAIDEQTSLVLVAGVPGRDGVSGSGGAIFYQILATIGAVPQIRYPLVGVPAANSGLLFLNGLLETLWHVEGLELVIDATLLPGDVVLFRYTL